jgi:hypothetical protein
MTTAVHKENTNVYFEVASFLNFIGGFGLIPGVIITNVRDMTGRGLLILKQIPTGSYIRLPVSQLWTNLNFKI